MKIAPYFPDQTQSVHFAISADDCLLHFQAHELTPKQREDDTANKDLIALLQVGSLFLAKPEDRVSFYEAFQAPEWQSLLDFYRSRFADLGLTPPPLARCAYYSRDDFYRVLAAEGTDRDLVTVYLWSGSNQSLHPSERALEISRAVNSKMQLARDAAQWNLPVPRTLVCRKRDLTGPAVADFWAAEAGPLMLKIMGLAGARNVTTVASVTECQAYLAEFDDDLELVLQQKLPLDRYQEMTVDLRVSDSHVEIANIRRILFSDGLWVGNHLTHRLTLTDDQQAALLRVGDYVRALGYSAPEGLNCGIDFFISDDDLRITELNARWTGGLLPALMRQRVGATNRDAIVTFDMVRHSQLDAYRAFVETHLYGREPEGFGVIPLGFSPFLYQPPGGGPPMTHVWQMVLGDCAAFRTVKNRELGELDLPVTGRVDPDA